MASDISKQRLLVSLVKPLLLAMKNDNNNADYYDCGQANQHNNVELLGGVNEHLKSPIGVTRAGKYNELRVRNDRGPHLLEPLAFD
jgi:hypothetical protein